MVDEKYIDDQDNKKSYYGFESCKQNSVNVVAK